MTQDPSSATQERLTVIEDVQVHLVSYPIGAKFTCHVDNIDPGAVIGRGLASTREEAEAEALRSAAASLSLVAARKRMAAATDKMRAAKK